jgi:hypothetical protein
MSVNIKTLTDAFTTKVDNVDFVQASHINSLQSALKELANATLTQRSYANGESIVATKTLTDSDTFYQVYYLTGNQQVRLPAPGLENHAFLIYNDSVSATDLSVRDSTGATTYVTLQQGNFALFFPIPGAWDFLRSGYDNYFNIQVVIGDGISTITTGIKGDAEVPFDGTIVGWTLVEGTGTTGSIVIDVWKDIYANFPPTVLDTIAGSEKPTLSSAQKNQDLSLSTWTTAITRGDILRFNVSSVTSVKQVTLCLRCQRT